MNQRAAKIIKRRARNDDERRREDVKMSKAEMLAAFDELWRIEHSEDLATLRAKQQKAKALREAIASLDN
jgi:hypothetical protein